MYYSFNICVHFIEYYSILTKNILNILSITALKVILLDKFLWGIRLGIHVEKIQSVETNILASTWDSQNTIIYLRMCPKFPHIQLLHIHRFQSRNKCWVYNIVE